MLALPDIWRKSNKAEIIKPNQLVGKYFRDSLPQGRKP